MSYCLSEYEFERQATKLIGKISEAEEKLNLLRHELLSLGLKGECDKCENKLKCITTAA